MISTIAATLAREHGQYGWRNMTKVDLPELGAISELWGHWLLEGPEGAGVPEYRCKFEIPTTAAASHSPAIIQLPSRKDEIMVT